MEISLIGAGNLAWHLAPALETAGHHINEVHGRQLKHARQLISNLYDARTHSDLNFAESPSQLFILAVSDDAIESVCSQLVLPEGATLVHVSGSQSLTSLANWIDIYSDVPVHTGVFYPVQTFSREQPLIDFATIPFCIEASTDTTRQLLIQIAQDMSPIVYTLNSEERLRLHMAAVFACNFTNHLLAIAHDLLATNNLPFDLIRPLVAETLAKGLNTDDPASVQTGPARRRDQTTMGRHLSLLSTQPDLYSIYQLISERIQRESV
ncbi:Rossmann-like and DUF2520 domain-containing protein [Spirosoma sp. KUDC1026]|uniref:Rossmann-like and DUF2520 domain-containing protein n=1 Tax=Spirosoma sp. KUDC1026 TaxID=2745947 RepID=UPI00159B902C|nr:Rossmann-like and DUF2520 domain-containing protein [Spirosoma sp. KUDC1026]QKZ11369.1 DUF2520 domain-containing protein [Spirosoma sp. KUDC1026]